MAILGVSQLYQTFKIFISTISLLKYGSPGVRRIVVLNAALFQICEL